MYKKLLLVLVVVFGVGFLASVEAQVTGLDEWSVYLDPGHSQQENMGLYNYSEAEKVLRVGLALREMLNEWTDIDKVYMSREDDEVIVTLSERSDHANEVNADFFHSIHSDAGASHVNSTLFLYGGWRENGETVEKTPEGGKKMGDIMDEDLPGHMRIPTRGNYADRTFYQGFPDNHANQWPFLHVNRETIMASVLSEAGFHTNPTQQMRNLNAEWKRLEAQSAFWSFLEFHDIERPPYGIVTGYISDIESGKLINGATVTIEDQTYTTDTYESLFHQYSDDPDQLRNGFYYFEDLSYGDTLDVYFGGTGFYPDTTSVIVKDDDMTFLDFQLLSSQPPYIAALDPEQGEERIRMTGFVRITFSRPMNRDSVESALSIDPHIEGLEWLWTSDHTQVGFTRDALDFLTEYTITIGEGAEDVQGHKFDGNMDGEEGGIFEYTFTTPPEDTDPPVVVRTWPEEEKRDVELQPIVSFMFDEELDDASIHNETILVTDHNDEPVNGIVKHYVVDITSVVQFFPDESLRSNTLYTATLAEGIEDIWGNATTSPFVYDFYTGTRAIDQVDIIDDFDGGLGNWWHPEQSGSTTGIDADETAREPETVIVNPITGSDIAMRVSYGWDTGAGSHLIRLHTPATSSAGGVRFDDSYIMQAYVFGDGSGNSFRFVVRERGAATPASYEASPWYTLDWIGWKRISWDLQNDPVIAWVNGDGELEPPLLIDSFQLTFDDGGEETGSVVFDDLRVVSKVATGVDRIAETVPDDFNLEQNYPNPFNPSTTIDFSIPEQVQVTLEIYNVLGQRVATLVSGEMYDPGHYNVVWDGRNQAGNPVSSGMYIYRIQAGDFTDVKKMMFLK